MANKKRRGGKEKLKGRDGGIGRGAGRVGRRRQEEEEEESTLKARRGQMRWGGCPMEDVFWREVNC